MASEPADYALEAEDLAKHYGDREAVRDVSFGIRRGEFFGLLGPNGAGKTTTLGMLSGLIVPSRGRIRIGGRPAQPRGAELKGKLGLVPQDLAFYPSLSARDNLSFFGAIFGLRGRRLRARIDAVLELAGLAGRAEEPVARFSGGMQRRLNIAIGLLHEPEILVLDEPTVGIDAQSRHAILEALRQLNRAGITVVYSTHYLEEAESLCGRVAILDRGRVVALDAPRELIRALDRGVVEIDFGEPPPPELLARLESLAVLRVAAGAPSRVRLAAPRPEDLLPDVFTAARQADLPIRQLRLLEPSLETVFLQLTGRQPRD